MKAESRRHMRRMLNSKNLDRITCFAQASTRRDWAGIAPSFLTVDATWNCNYDCRGCIDTTARDGSPVVRKKQGGDPLCVDAGACEGPSLSWKALEGVIRFVKEAKLNGVQLMGGESLLHPQIDPFVEELAHNRVPVEIVTNGSLIHMREFRGHST